MKIFTRPPCINRLRLDFAQSKSRPKVLQVPIQSQHGALQSDYEVDESDSNVGAVRGEKKLGNDDELDEDEDDDDDEFDDAWDDFGNAASSSIHDSDYAILDKNLRQLCSTGFTPSFIGDTMAELGVPCPLDWDDRIGNYMTGEQIFALMQSLSTLDPFEANEDYSDETMYELADLYKLSEKKVKYICEKERINLPFAMWTCLHKNLEERFVEVVESGTYDDFDDDRYIPNTPNIEEIVSTFAETVAAEQRDEE